MAEAHSYDEAVPRRHQRLASLVTSLDQKRGRAGTGDDYLLPKTAGEHLRRRDRVRARRTALAISEEARLNAETRYRG